MGVEDNKALVRRYWEEVWNAGKLELLPDLFPREHVEGQRFFVGRTMSAFSESRVAVADLIAEGDQVVTRYDWTAAHTGVWDVDLAGVSMAVPPTGRRIWDRGIALSRIDGGLIVDMPSEWTMLELAQQLGAVRLPGWDALPPPLPSAPRPTAGGALSSPEEAKALVLRYLEDVVGRRDLAVADAVFAPDFRIAPDAAPGPTGVANFLAGLLTAFPDLRVAVEDVIAEGDKVAARLTVSGTHRGVWRGFPPTGRAFRVGEMQLYRVAGGRLAERWAEVDRLGMLRQLSLLPPPGNAAS